MRGRVLAVPEAGTPGVITGDDGQRYRFADADLRGLVPRPGQEVDFEALAGQAREIYVIPGPPILNPAVADALAKSDWVSFYLSPSGRIGRRDYWLYGFLVLFVVSFVLSLIPVIGPIITLPLYWCGFALAIKRCHDVNRSGWWLLLPYAPLPLLIVGIAMASAARDGTVGVVLASIAGLAMLGLSLWFLFAVLVRPGDRGPNRFGPIPAPIRG